MTNHASIFSLEAMAIIQALDTVKSDKSPKIYVFSDSENVLEALSSLSNWNQKFFLIWEIKTRIFNLSKIGKSVTLLWIPAHVGIRHNEIADWTAKAAID